MFSECGSNTLVQEHLFIVSRIYNNGFDDKEKVIIFRSDKSFNETSENCRLGEVLTKKRKRFDDVET